MENLIEILEGTPWWVFLILAYLLYVGFKAAHKRTVTLPKLFLLPSLLVLWSLYGLYERWQGQWTDVCYWVIALVVGSLAGWWIVHKWKIHVDRGRQVLILPGSWSTMWLVLAIFAVRYFFGYYDATHPSIPHSIFLIDLIVSGVIVGIFIGRCANYFYRYEKVV